MSDPPPDPDSPSVREISVNELGEEKVGPDPFTPTQKMGYWIFKWLLLLAMIILGLLLLYAWSTYPRFGDVKALVGTSTDPTPFAAWQDARSAWETQIKDLGQIFLLTPVFPLIGAVLGYIFGREAPASGN